jgi:hypothetical protein
MYSKIINSNLSLKKKLKALFLYFSSYTTNTKSFVKRYERNYKNGFVMTHKINAEQKKEYINYWKSLHDNVETDTVSMCYTISGKYDKRIIPENVFPTDIEPTLNTRAEVLFLQHKSVYNKWFRPGTFPVDYFHKIDGQLLDIYLRPITIEEVAVRLQSAAFPIVVKPNIDTQGGENVYFPKTVEETLELIGRYDDIVAQEKIKQHQFFNEIYPDSINTIRVCTYKSVTDNKWHVLNASLRMGKDGSLDNLKAGGIVCNIDSTGKLNHYAADVFGRRYDSHPNTGFDFNCLIPDYTGMCEKAIDVSSQIFDTKLTSLDMCLDSKGEWKIIEVNLKSQTIRFAQYGGEPFFGKFTDEVLDYCARNHWALSVN